MGGILEPEAQETMSFWHLTQEAGHRTLSEARQAWLGLPVSALLLSIRVHSRI